MGAMMMDFAVRVNRWLEAHKGLVAIVTWTCFALVCADYARFIDLPTILVVPFWAGVVLNVLRWTVWEGMLKPRVQARTAEESGSAAVEEGV
jgi:hypothetical protein